MWFSWPNYIKWLLWCFQSHGDVLHSLSFSNLDGNQTLGFGESTNDVRLIFVQNLEVICQFPGKNCRWMGNDCFISNALLSFQVEQSGQRWGKISHDDFLDVLWNKDGDQMTEFKVWRELTTQKKNWKILSFLRNVNIFIILNAHCAVAHAKSRPWMQFWYLFLFSYFPLVFFCNFLLKNPTHTPI